MIAHLMMDAIRVDARRWLGAIMACMPAPRDFVVRHAQPAEMLQVGVLVARTFTPGAPERYPAVLHGSGEGLLTKPGFDSAMCRIGLVDGQIVSHARVEPYHLRYGSARLRVSGVAAVCTHPDHRRRGYSAAVMRDALAYMAEQGIHFALLHSTVGGYYRRFGFSPVWPHYEFEVDSAAAAALNGSLRLRDARPGDAPCMAALYERHWGGRTAFIRSAPEWVWRVACGYFEAQVVEDYAGEIVGYIAGYDLVQPRVDVVADTPDAAMTLLAAIGRRCQEAGLATIRWAIPPDDALVNFARQAMTVRLSAEYQPDDGWMARLIDTQGFVDTLLPEIVAQAQTVLPELDANALTFNCQPDVVEIGLRGQKTARCRLNHPDFIQIVFGSLYPSALAARPSSGLHPDAVRLLEALFPPRVAALAGWDWF